MAEDNKSEMAEKREWLILFLTDLIRECNMDSLEINSDVTFIKVKTPEFMPESTIAELFDKEIFTLKVERNLHPTYGISHKIPYYNKESKINARRLSNDR